MTFRIAIDLPALKRKLDAIKNPVTKEMTVRAKILELDGMLDALKQQAILLAEMMGKEYNQNVINEFNNVMADLELVVQMEYKLNELLPPDAASEARMKSNQDLVANIRNASNRFSDRLK